MTTNFRKALLKDHPYIWKILQQAIHRRKLDGSNQWQDGYPNAESVTNDIEKGVGFVLTVDEIIAGYAAILINDEPAYAALKGKWLTNGDFVVLHRLAISDEMAGKGLAVKIMHHVENIAIQNGIYSVKADTNFDNTPMLKIFDRLGYIYCGEVMFRGGIRKAFEKILK